MKFTTLLCGGFLVVAALLTVENHTGLDLGLLESQQDAEVPVVADEPTSTAGTQSASLQSRRDRKRSADDSLRTESGARLARKPRSAAPTMPAARRDWQRRIADANAEASWRRDLIARAKAEGLYEAIEREKKKTPGGAANIQ